MKSIVITGVAGFVLSNAARALYEAGGYEVYGIDNMKFGNIKNIPQGIAYSIMDFNDSYEKLLNTYDVLVHGATSNIIYAMEHVPETIVNNAVNTIKLFQKFKGKIIYISTASVYSSASVFPTPETAQLFSTNAYDGSKLTAELYLKQRGNYTTLRLSNVYGYNQRAENPYCGVVSKFIESAMKGESVTMIGNGSQTRDFTFVDDVSKAIIMAIEQPAQDTEINIATGIETQIRNLAVEIFRAADKVPKFEFVQKRKIDNIDRRCLDISKAKELLNWSPQTSLKEGLEKTIKWVYSEHH